MTDDYRNPNHPGYGPEWLTGKSCIERCGRPAGTAWSPLWCAECNIARMDRVTNALRRLVVAADLTPKTFTQTAEHFTSVTTKVDWPTDEPDID